MGRPKAGITPIMRFMSSFIRDPSGCWNWTGIKRANEKGLTYGRFSINKKMYQAHRWSWEFFISKIPDEFFICHKCDNPLCVNPKHLFLGSPRDNAVDMVIKNRHWADKNKSPDVSRLVEFNGHRRLLSEWSRITNIKYATLRARFVRGDRDSFLFRAVP